VVWLFSFVLDSGESEVRQRLPVGVPDDVAAGHRGSARQGDGKRRGPRAAEVQLLLPD
jgi:hypothetical protein